MPSDPRARPCIPATVEDILADEIDRWMRSDRIALMYAPEIMRGENIRPQAARDLAHILVLRLEQEMS